MINTNLILCNALVETSVEPNLERIRGDVLPTFGAVTVEPDEDENATELLPDEHSVPPPIPVLPEEDEDVSSAGRNEEARRKEKRKRTTRGKII